VATLDTVNRIVDTSVGLVEEKFATSQAYATESFNLAADLLNRLSSLLEGLRVQNVNVSIASPGSPPEFSDLMDQLPDSEQIKQEILAILDEIGSILVPESPEFIIPDSIATPEVPNVPGDPPALDDITPPTPFEGTIPEMEPLEMPGDIPPPDEFTDTPPVAELPYIPEPPSIIVPEFTDDLDLSDLSFVPPEFKFEENFPYTSATYEFLTSNLERRITEGGTGLPQNIETEIWNRDHERSEQQKRDSIDKAASEWAARGFDLPGGDVEGKILVIETEYMNKRLESSRDIAIKQAELEQKNVLEAINSSVTLEQAVITYTSGYWQRQLEFNKLSAEIAIKIFEANVKKYEMLIEKFKAQIQRFDTLVKAELAKVQLYTAQVDAAKAVVSFETAKIDIYKSQVQAYAVMVDAYKSRVQAAVARFEIEKVKLEKFKALIEAFVAQVNVKTSEYNLYNAQITGEKNKVDLYRGQIEAYRAQIEGINAQTQALTANLDATSKYNDSLAKKYGSEIEGYSALVKTEIGKAEVGMKGMEVQASNFNAITRAYEAIANLDVKEYDAQIQLAIAQAQIHLKNAEVELSNYEKVKSIAVEGLKGGSQVAAQMAAGALAAVSAQAIIDAKGSGSLAASDSTETRTEYIYQF
jgi:hypothetical protein